MRGWRRYRGIVGVLAMVVVAACSNSVGVPAAQDGDIIFQTSQSSQSLAIQRATGSKFSHMGIVLLRQGSPWVLEASATVRYTPLGTWIAHGIGHHYELKRLKKPSALTPAQVAQLRRTAEGFLGKPYDLTFEWSDERMYCSELVYKIYDRALGLKIGELQRVRDSTSRIRRCRRR
jgi:hypothetical protein